LPGSTEKNKISNIKRIIKFAVDKFGMEPDPQRWTAEGTYYYIHVGFIFFKIAIITK